MLFDRKSVLTFRARVLIVLGACTSMTIATDALAQPWNHQTVQTISNGNGQLICRNTIDRLGQTPAHIKAATSSRPWRIFDQRSIFFAVRSKSVEAQGIPGGRALEVKIDRKEPYAYDIGVSMLNQRPIVRGSVVEARVWLRTTSGPRTTIVARLQNNELGFRRLAETPLTLTSQFREYVLTTQAYKDYCPGTFNFALHLATGEQIVEIGPGLLIVRENPLVS
jgi:hypothetical protein